MSGSATTWGAGDYPAMARRLMPVAEAVVAAAAVREGDRVVDVATGTGNAAVLAALCGARTTGVDLEPALLRVAGQHAAEAGLAVDWLVGDASRLPLPDDCADVVAFRLRRHVRDGPRCRRRLSWPGSAPAGGGWCSPPGRLAV